MLHRFVVEKKAPLVAFLLSLAIVVCTSILARITLTIQGASLLNPDIAIYTLLHDDGITNATLLRSKENERHYIVEMNGAESLVILKKDTEWKVDHREVLRQ